MPGAGDLRQRGTDSSTASARGLRGSRTEDGTFITSTEAQETAYRLAEATLQSPPGPFNVELEEAQEQLRLTVEQLKATQQEYEARTRQLEAREAALEAREVEIQKRKQEVNSYVSRGREKQQRSREAFRHKTDEIIAAAAEISRLTDAISGATALLSVLIERNTVYRVYTRFMEAAYARLSTKDEATTSEQLAAMKKYEKVKYMSTCHEYVTGAFLRLINEDKAGREAEARVHQEYDAVIEAYKEEQTTSRIRIADLEQKITQINSQLDALTLRKEALTQDNGTLTFKLHSRNQDISGVYSAVKNLLERIPDLVEERHVYFTSKASLSELLGAKNPALEEKISSLFISANGMISMEECYRKVIGDQLLAKLRDVYQLGIVLEDGLEMVRISQQGNSQR